jgi:hypothetical protein
MDPPPPPPPITLNSYNKKERKQSSGLISPVKSEKKSPEATGLPTMQSPVKSSSSRNPSIKSHTSTSPIKLSKSPDLDAAPSGLNIERYQSNGHLINVTEMDDQINGNKTELYQGNAVEFHANGNWSNSTTRDNLANANGSDKGKSDQDRSVSTLQVSYLWQVTASDLANEKIVSIPFGPIDWGWQIM